MAQHTDNVNHNTWYDPVVLTGTCTYVNVGDGCSGTIKDCNHCDIGENNGELDLNNCENITIGSNNTITIGSGNTGTATTAIKLTDSSDIVIGSGNSISVGDNNEGNITRLTMTDCHYVEIGSDNVVVVGDNNNYNTLDPIQRTLDLSVIGFNLDSSTYVVIGDNNDNIVVIDSDYVIVGNNNSNVHIGEQRDTTQFPTSSGANSILVATECRGIDITGTYAELDRTNYVAVDGCFNKFKDSSTITAVCTGNTFDNARFVDVAATNNNYIYADNLTLKSKEAFFSYNKVKDVLKVQPIYKPIEQQSDSFGTILDRPNSKITNDTPKAGDYVLDNGRWVLRT